MSIAADNRDHSPLILIAVSSTATLDGFAVGGCQRYQRLDVPTERSLDGTFNAEEPKNLLCLSQRTTVVEPDGECPDERRRPLTLSTFKIRGF